jgi:hypothetical protein
MIGSFQKLISFLMAYVSSNINSRGQRVLSMQAAAARFLITT